MARRNDKPINEVLNNFIHSCEKITKGVAGVTIENIYRKEMGEVVNNYTEAIKLRGDTLYIVVKSAPLRHELMNARFNMIQDLNKAFGGEVIKKIVVR